MADEMEEQTETVGSSYVKPQVWKQLKAEEDKYFLQHSNYLPDDFTIEKFY
jgi:hypothetical protein